ncbi:hypothetical protein J3998_07030 [Thiomicrorhabdus sp. 6S2-11]|uniref:HEPN domain-containing protein n=1 Tax=Thiomicrorhabdus marina TaxID=2818442 RepID=A0ABS3Q4R2_9GAMM|nr:hypothetical protein [Thiomicrorhabdus marina]MBO1927329.1 hypothetical protein [Thiomicrorhabdus marina]
MEYSLEFAQRLIESAEALFNEPNVKPETDRTILYLSCLSCEISFKALLEHTGFLPKEIKKLSHNFDEILNEVGTCRFISTNKRATSIRGKKVVPNTANGTVGTLLNTNQGSSIYPNEIRYGETVTHFPPETMLNCAKVVNEWCKHCEGKLVRTNNG